MKGFSYLFLVLFLLTSYSAEAISTRQNPRLPQKELVSEDYYPYPREFQTRLTEEGSVLLITPPNLELIPSNMRVQVWGKHPKEEVIMELWDVTCVGMTIEELSNLDIEELEKTGKLFKNISFCYFQNGKTSIFEAPGYNLHLVNGRVYQLRIFRKEENTKKILLRNHFLATVDRDDEYRPRPLDD